MAPYKLVDGAGEPNVAWEMDAKTPQQVFSVRVMLKVAVDQLCDDALLFADAGNIDLAMDILDGIMDTTRPEVARV